MTTQMTMRERILAVVRGTGELDRVPFVQYWGTAAPNGEAWAVLGRENMGLLRWTRVHRMETPNCRFEAEPVTVDGIRGERRTLFTPRGELKEFRLFQPTYGAASIKEHFVKAPADYDTLVSYFEDGVVVEDLAPLETCRAELGEDGLPLVAVDRTPYQQLWVQWVNIADLACHLVDCPDKVQRCMDVMTRRQREVFEIVRRAPIDFVDVPDNITAPLVGEAYFRRFCVPAYDELAEMLAERDVPVFVHMDGDLKPLSAAIAACGVRGLDSFSPQPDNDTSVREAVEMWPEMRLLVNFPSSVHLRRPQEIYDEASRILEEGGRTGRLQIQISENVPPGLWRTSFPEIVRAVRDFGRP